MLTWCYIAGQDRLQQHSSRENEAVAEDAGAAGGGPGLGSRAPSSLTDEVARTDESSPAHRLLRRGSAATSGVIVQRSAECASCGRQPPGTRCSTPLTTVLRAVKGLDKT